MMSGWYDRDGRRLPDTLPPEEMAKYWSEDYRRVASTHVGETHISTVLLLIDHNWRGVGKPVIFETMVFNYERPRTLWQRLARKQPEEREYQVRYCTLDEATEGHMKLHAAVENKTLDAVYDAWYDNDE